MTQGKDDQVHRHPDAVAYLEDLGQEGAAMERPYEGGHVRYWMEGGEVRSLDVAEDGPLPALLATMSAEFGRRLPQLAADLASDVPDLGGVERALRDSSLGGGRAALKLLLERLDSALPAPECDGCGKRTPLCQKGKRKSFLSQLGRLEVERRYFHCQSCGKGRYPLDRALGLEGDTHTPGMASVMAETVTRMGYEAAARHIGNLAGVEVPSSSLQRWTVALGEKAIGFEREEVVEDKPLKKLACLSIDGTGTPMRKEEMEGVSGKQEDGSAKTREAKLIVAYSADDRDPETGAALKDRGSETCSCLIDSAAVSAGGEPSGFAMRLGRECRRRGLHEAKEVAIISDGAEWIRNACEKELGRERLTLVLDLYHALEYLSAAVKAALPEGEERQQRLREARADIEAGRAEKVVRELEPFRGRHRDVEACCRQFRNNLDRMRYGEYRDRGIQVGSGVVESGCKRFGLRMKRSGMRWSKRGANAMLAIKSCVMNGRVPDLLAWKAGQATAAA